MTEVYECLFYRGIGVKFCKYYPDWCNKCGELIKLGTKKEEINIIDENYIPYKLLLAGYENLNWIGKLHWHWCEIKHKIICLLKNGITIDAEKKED